MIKLLIIIVIAVVIFILVIISTKDTARATIFAVLAGFAATLGFVGPYIVEFVESQNQDIESNEEKDIEDIEGNVESSNEGLSQREERQTDISEIVESEGHDEEYAEDTAFITFIGESHEPSDIANKAEVSDQVEDKDYDLSGKTYSGGVKIAIFNMFSALDGNSSNKVTQIVSESHFAIDTDKMESLPDEYKQLIGKFVVGKDTDGSPSTAIITILADNEEVYNSGEINCYSLDIPPFDIPLLGRKELIIKVVCQHRGNPFVIGMVDDK